MHVDCTECCRKLDVQWFVTLVADHDGCLSGIFGEKIDFDLPRFDGLEHFDLCRSRLVSTVLLLRFVSRTGNASEHHHASDCHLERMISFHWIPL